MVQVAKGKVGIQVVFVYNKGNSIVGYFGGFRLNVNAIKICCF